MKTFLLRIAAVLLGTASLKAAEPLLNRLLAPDCGWITSDRTLFWNTNDVNNKASISPGFRTASNSTHTYVTGWAGGDPALLRASATVVLRNAEKIMEELRHRTATLPERQTASPTPARTWGAARRRPSVHPGPVLER